jgi:hypothetical protein
VNPAIIACPELCTRTSLDPSVRRNLCRRAYLGSRTQCWRANELPKIREKCSLGEGLHFTLRMVVGPPFLGSFQRSNFQPRNSLSSAIIAENPLAPKGRLNSVKCLFLRHRGQVLTGQISVGQKVCVSSVYY